MPTDSPREPRRRDQKVSIPSSRLYRERIGNRNARARAEEDWKCWPPLVEWAREKGVLRVRDPKDCTWFLILAKDAPSGYVRLANLAKYGRP